MNKEELAKQWVDLQYSKAKPIENDPNFSSNMEIDDLCDDFPLEALSVIEKIISIDSNDHILSNVAAGPIEDLLSRHGASVIDEIESICSGNDNFKKALGAVWENDISQDVWQKVVKLADKSWL